MKHATISMVRNHLSHYLRAVRRGETVEILDRDVPIARVVPIAPPKPGAPKADEEAWLSRMEKKGILKRGTGKPLPDSFFENFPPKGEPLPSSAVEAVLDERRSGW